MDTNDEISKSSQPNVPQVMTFDELYKLARNYIAIEIRKTNNAQVRQLLVGAKCAIDMQIPMPVVRYKDGKCACNCCNTVLRKKDEFCPRCGQRADWYTEEMVEFDRDLW